MSLGLLRAHSHGKEGVTVLMLESSKYWNITMAVIFVIAMVKSDFIIVTHLETSWKIDVWKTGGLLYFSPASISLDMTQPADNINSTNTRHMFTTVIRYNDVVHYAADMQTQLTESNEDPAIIGQHNAIVTDDIINDEKNSSSGVSKHFYKMKKRSRYDVTHNGFHEQFSILYVRKQSIIPVSSVQAHVIMVAKKQHNFRRGLLSTMKKRK